MHHFLLCKSWSYNTFFYFLYTSLHAQLPRQCTKQAKVTIFSFITQNGEMPTWNHSINQFMSTVSQIWLTLTSPCAICMNILVVWESKGKMRNYKALWTQVEQLNVLSVNDKIVFVWIFDDIITIRGETTKTVQ